MATDVAVMSQKDRIELRRIMKARFELLQEQLGQREREIRNAIQADIEAQHAAAVKEAERKARALATKAAKIDRRVTEFKAKIEEEAAQLKAESEALEAEMKDQGVVPHDDGYYARRNGTIPALRLNDERWYDSEKFIVVTKDWRPDDLNSKVSKAYRQITMQAGLHKLDLRMKELELSEELAIGALGSTEAKDFLRKVPTIDTLLPAPSKKSLKKAEQVVVTIED